MLRYIFKRLKLMLLTLFGVSVLVFLLLQVMPGDPVDSLLPPDATPDMRKELEADLGFDKPIPVQYVNWVTRAVRLDFGESIMYQKDVLEMFGEYFWNTVLLAVSSCVFAIIFAILIGFFGAIKQKSFFAFFSNIVGISGVSIPNYWLALILLGVFSVMLNKLPSFGMHAYGVTSFRDLLMHLILPTIAGGAATLGILTSMVRSTVSEIIKADFITTLRAKGMKKKSIYLHVFKNSLPTIFTVGGLQFGYLLGGSAIVETIFAWPGIGQMVYKAITQRDFPVIQGTILIIALLFVILNLVIDLLVAYIDPRIRQ
jgi:peptide/nickel transport system permease protein